MVAPPKTPAALAERMSAAFNEALQHPDVRRRFAEMSAEPVGMTPADMGRFMKEDAERWRKAIEAVGLKPE